LIGGFQLSQRQKALIEGVLSTKFDLKKIEHWQQVRDLA